MSSAPRRRQSLDHGSGDAGGSVRPGNGLSGNEPFRNGSSRNAVEGRIPVPPAAAALGREFVRFELESRTIELRFNATDEFTNPFGNVHGGFLAAMLYDTVGPALLATLWPHEYQSTTELTIAFLRPARPGPIRAVGRVEHQDGELAMLEAGLFDPDGRLIASAIASARVIPLAAARAGA